MRLLPLLPHTPKDTMTDPLTATKDSLEPTRTCNVQGGPVLVSSFGHCFGTTPGADHVLNARKVQNPGARGSTGLHKKVRQAVFADPKARQLVEQGVLLVIEAAAPFHLAVGCERGRHRSVAIATDIAAELTKRCFHVQVHHRDIHKSKRTHTARRKNKTTYMKE